MCPPICIFWLSEGYSKDVICLLHLAESEECIAKCPIEILQDSNKGPPIPCPKTVPDNLKEPRHRINSSELG